MKESIHKEFLVKIEGMLRAGYSRTDISNKLDIEPDELEDMINKYILTISEE